MPFRRSEAGPREWIDRSRAIAFHFEGQEYSAHPGDTLSSALLERLETNNRPRLAEAEQMRARAAELHAQHAEALPEGRAWLGLEPWYGAYEVDWMRACDDADDGD